MFIPSNDLAKLAVGAGQAVRLELADQLYYPVAVDYYNTSQPMEGGSIGNRSGQPTRLTDPDIDGNTGGYGADFSALTGDPVAMIRTKTSDGVVFRAVGYTGKGIITMEDQQLNPPGLYNSVPRYIVKADGVIYDLLELRGQDTGANGGNGPYQHWEFAVAEPASGYDEANNQYFADGTNPPGANPAIAAQAQYPFVTDFQPQNITPDYYVRPVGFLSFRDKSGASSGFIQEQLNRAQSSLDSLSRFLRTLHDEAKGPLANIVVR